MNQTYPSVKPDLAHFEEELYSKNTKWVDKSPLRIVELDNSTLPRERNSGNVLSVMAQLDRDFVHIGENVFSISNQPI